MNEIIKETLYSFTSSPLFDAVEELLEKLQIRFEANSKMPMAFEDLYSGMVSSPMPLALREVVSKIAETYLIGSVDEETLNGNASSFELGQPIEGKYYTMVIFAVDIKNGESLSRSELATLTRGFNRMAPELPVVVFIRNGKYLTLATCERSEYKQNWRQGEKLGKVSILRDINCEKPHRGHLDILTSLGDKAYYTYEDLYKHWLAVFSSELLTKKFYTELSEWYAWVIGSGKVKFPNDISTTEDDFKYNHEAVIRLITRLIFVWFLKQKHLIPKEFFDEKAIREYFIENFDPHSDNTLFYNPEESKYYRLILQNLFFAMLNRPIMDEESDNKENRRFATSKRIKGISPDYNINNLLRYQSEFKDGGDNKLLELANSHVPFLNGGLFECLDDKDNGMYYDGFSERKVSLEQLSFPDYFFFGEEVGANVDLSAWYGINDKHSNVRGLINILRSYNFTVEENTPLDQEVSLDPELLGKVFENLLASYNPETNTTARKQTGSFYTPRDIVKYMVDESLISHLTRYCSSLDETILRNLFDYSVDNFELPEKERKSIMAALYNCKVLDPACGSGAFPMGILQQMVHALRKLDPSNEMWREFILEISLKRDEEAYHIEDEEERNRLRTDIEQSFNRQVNDPDYARKLYLIENCIYGVDIQPIATQISKLRFFISLVAEQKPKYDDPINNFGIRPLPNLEANFVSANTLIPLGEGNIFTNTERISKIKKRLSEANHKLFVAKRNANKRKIREDISSIRKEYADELISIGAVAEDNAMKIASWNMFEQNEYARFFDPQWMFGISSGFDLIIANPPYVSIKEIPSELVTIYKSKYTSAKRQTDLYAIFLEKALQLSKKGGTICFIVPDSLNERSNFESIRNKILKESGIASLLTLNKVFESASVGSSIITFSKERKYSTSKLLKTEDKVSFSNNEIKTILIPQHLFEKNDYKAFLFLTEQEMSLIHRLFKSGQSLEIFSDFMGRGEEIGRNSEIISYTSGTNKSLMVNGTHVSRYSILESDMFIDRSDVEKDFNKYYKSPKILVRQVGTCINATLDLNNCVCPQSIYIIKLDNEEECKYVLGLLNSRLFNYIYQKKFNTKKLFPRILLENLKILPIKRDNRYFNPLINLINKRFDPKVNNIKVEQSIDFLVYHIYELTYNEVKLIDPETPITEEEYNSYK
ncbi:MAG: N-6 DNA methylase [Muribaculaceae bacterium]|nr:N-6 DNA methylase [Muribaculaceae bacterium]